MSSLQDDLIHLFATVPELEKKPEVFCEFFGKASYNEVRMIDGYEDEYEPVSWAKETIERIVKQTDDVRSQVRGILTSIEHQVPKKKETLYKLARESCYHKWLRADQDAFDRKYELITTWKHYFLSYTNAAAYRTNQEFMRLIAQFLVIPDRNSRQWRNENYLAKAIAECIQEHGLSGFCDVADIHIGQAILDRVRATCNRTLALMQLVERVSFNPPRDMNGVNWSYREYSEFVRREMPNACMSCDEGLFFVVVGNEVKDVKPANMPAEYEEWYHDCEKRASVLIRGLPGLHDNVERASIELSSRIEKIANDIVGIRKRFIDELLIKVN